MIQGDDLALAIKEMGHNPNSFAKLIGVSQTAILNLINNPKVKPKDSTRVLVELALSHRCRTCGQHTEKSDAWNHPPPEPESSGRKRKTLDA